MTGRLTAHVVRRRLIKYFKNICSQAHLAMQCTHIHALPTSDVFLIAYGTFNRGSSRPLQTRIAQRIPRGRFTKVSRERFRNFLCHLGMFIHYSGCRVKDNALASGSEILRAVWLPVISLKRTGSGAAPPRLEFPGTAGSVQSAQCSPCLMADPAGYCLTGNGGARNVVELFF